MRDRGDHDLAHLIRVLQILNLLLLIQIQADKTEAITPEEHRLLQSEVHHHLLALLVEDHALALHLLPGSILREAELGDIGHEVPELLLLVNFFVSVWNIIEDF